MSPAGPPLFPGLADLPANVPMSAMLGIPPAEQQAAVIEQVKAMMASPDPALRAKAQAYMDTMGRNMFMVGLNRATAFPGSDKGLSDQLLTGQASGLGMMRGAYSPEAMDYAKRLTQAVRPGEYHGAEMAGTAGSLAAMLLPYGAHVLRRYLQSRPPPSPLSPGGTTPGPLIPEPPPDRPPGPSLLPPDRPFGWTPKPPPPPPPEFPRVIEDLRAFGPEPPPRPGRGPPGEEPAYNKALDNPGANVKRQLPGMTMKEWQELFGDLLKKK
jgi:hypothetical protein